MNAVKRVAKLAGAHKPSIAVFASGGGTDFQSIIDAVERGKINAEIALLVTNKDGIGAIERAKKHGIEYRVFLRSNYFDTNDMYKAITEVLTDKKIDLAVLAGYLGILSAELIRAFCGRIINVHPSLIPRHCGMGYYGIRVHESVLASGDSVTGVTVHYVTEEVDGGAIILQKEVPVYSDDIAETLQKRVLEVEHEVLPKAIIKVLGGK